MEIFIPSSSAGISEVGMTGSFYDPFMIGLPPTSESNLCHASRVLWHWVSAVGAECEVLSKFT